MLPSTYEDVAGALGPEADENCGSLFSESKIHEYDWDFYLVVIFVAAACDRLLPET